MNPTISYLQATNLSKRIGETILFENISLSISKDEKIGLIAKNGAGKTTLLQILSNRLQPDLGQITTRNNLTINYLEQDPPFFPSHSVLESVLQASEKTSAAIRDYEQALASGSKSRIEAAHHLMDHANAWDVEARIKQVLGKLSIPDVMQPMAELSGGQRKRVALANALLHPADLLILDEPTNHLDLDMVEWLEGYLKKINASLLMVTHDRYFLDRVCNLIMELDNHNLFRYQGNYSYFLEKREERIQATNTRIEKARGLYKKELDWINRSPSARGTKAKARIESFYELEEVANQKTSQKTVEINVPTPRIGKKILNLHYISKSFGSKKILDLFSYRFMPGEKVGIIGKNGSGKTTLLNIIAGLIKPDQGKMELGETIRLGYFRQEGIPLKENMKVIDLAREIAEVVTLSDGVKLAVSQFLNFFLFPPDMQRTPISKLSGGEKRRLQLVHVLMQNPNFLLLDEPTNDLDILTLNVLEEYLQSFAGCLLIVSHDRFFLDKITDHIFNFEGDGVVRDFPGNFSQFREAKAALPKTAQSKPEQARNPSPAKENKPQRAGFKEQFEFKKLEEEIQQLEQEKSKLESSLSSGLLSPKDLQTSSERLGQLLQEIDTKSNRWLELSELIDG